jgi:hypothetical protein
MFHPGQENLRNPWNPGYISHQLLWSVHSSVSDGTICHPGLPLGSIPGRRLVIDPPSLPSEHA